MVEQIEDRTGGALPLVAVGYGLRCVPVMALVEAAAGVCELAWLIDGHTTGMAETALLLARFGDVIDLSSPGATARLRALGPTGMVTYLDAPMTEMAAVADELGVAFHRPATAAALTDKHAQRAALAAAGLPGPRSVLVGADAPAEAVAGLAGRVGWPAVLKPRTGQGSRHTFLAGDPDEAVALLHALGPARQDMVIEDYLRGDPSRPGPFANYVSVESLACGGTISHLAVTGRFPLADNFRETGFFVPAALADGDRAEVLALATSALAALDVRDGCLHTEVKFTPDGPMIIEVNGRIGGGVAEMLDRAAGFPLLEWTLRAALGERLELADPVSCERVGYRLFLQPPSSSSAVIDIDGLDSLSHLRGVDTVSVHQHPGSALDWRDGSRNHILAVVGRADDHDDLRSLEARVRDTVEVTYAEAG